MRDLAGSHRDEFFFSTSAGMSMRRIVEAFAGRWDIEVTFEEMREHVGLETTRGRCRNTVLRVEPCLFCLYTLIVYWFDHLPRQKQRSDPRGLGRQDRHHVLRRDNQRALQCLGRLPFSTPGDRSGH